MLKKSYRILNVFVKNPTITYLFKDVKEYLGSKSESYTYDSLSFFVKNGILTKEKRGGLRIYNIAKTSKAISYLSMAAEHMAWNKKRFPIELICDLVERINLNFFSLLVVGSYAKDKQKQKSDLDVILIVIKNPKKISSRLKNFCELNIPSIRLYVFTDEEFKQMLLDKKYNYGKEAVKNNLIFYGAEAYYKILFEAMENGFTY